MRRFVILLLCAMPAFAASRPFVTDYAPKSVAVASGERYLTIYGGWLTGSVVRFSGPAGNFEMVPQGVYGFEPSVRMQVWIPQEIVNTIGHYSVVVHNDANGDADPFFIEVKGDSRIVLHAPPFIVAEATSPAGAVVSWEASAESTIGAPVSVSCTPASGSTFPLGLTHVTCTASSEDGASASTTFPVTVVDHTPPVLTVPADILVEAEEGEGGAHVTFSVTASDLIDTNVTVHCSQESGSLFRVGTTEVRCNAIDDSFNSAYGAFHITVVDVRRPVLTLPNDITVEALSPSATDVTYTATASEGTIVCTPPSGSTFPLGTTVVTCTAGTTTGTFKVNVVDTVAPQIVSITADPNRLWPVNRRLTDVTITVTAADDGDAMPHARITDVLVSEGAGAGDWMITGDLTVKLRAERNGVERPRTYTIVIEVRDASGNIATGTVDVVVPHDGGSEITIPQPQPRRRAAGHG